MAQITMYGAINNSPKTVVSVSMTASDTTIQVENVDALPAPPNLATLGEDENAEVISYSGKESNTLTGVVRGIKGTTASPWPTGTMVYRAYTAYDHDAFKANIEDLENRKVASVNNVMPDENKNILLSADDIEETASRVFVSPEQKAKIDTAYSTASGPLPIENGGTRADNAETARENLDVPQKVNVLGHNTQFNYTTYNGGDANDITREFHEFVFNMKNIPSSDSGYGFLDVSTTNGSGFAPSSQGVILQKFYGYSSSRMFYRTRRNGTTWSNWLCPFPFNGTYSGTGAEQTISLGFQPRFVMVKKIGATNHWWADQSSGDQYVTITSTGFTVSGTSSSGASYSGASYRYIAWR